MGDSSNAVLLDGSKSFWKTRRVLDVIIVEHFKWKTLEVLTYEPNLSAEAERLYLNDAVLRSRMDTAIIDRSLKVAKMKAIKNGEIPDIVNQIKAAEAKARVDYILARLFLRDSFSEERKITVELQFDFNDRDDEHGGMDVSTMVIQKPVDLEPFIKDWSQPKSPKQTSSKSLGGSSLKETSSSGGSGGAKAQAINTSKPNLIHRNTAPSLLTHSPVSANAGPANAGSNLIGSSNPFSLAHPGDVAGPDGSPAAADTVVSPPTKSVLGRRATAPNMSTHRECPSSALTHPGRKSGRWDAADGEGAPSNKSLYETLPVHQEENEHEAHEREDHSSSDVVDGISHTALPSGSDGISEQPACLSISIGGGKMPVDDHGNKIFLGSLRGMFNRSTSTGSNNKSKPSILRRWFNPFSRNGTKVSPAEAIEDDVAAKSAPKALHSPRQKGLSQKNQDSQCSSTEADDLTMSTLPSNNSSAKSNSPFLSSLIPAAAAAPSSSAAATAAIASTIEDGPSSPMCCITAPSSEKVHIVTNIEAPRIV